MNGIHAAWGLLGEALAPSTCAACGEEVRPLRAFCPTCARTIVDAEVDDDALRCVALGEFGGALADAVHALKFRDRPELAGPLGRLLAEKVRAGIDPRTARVPIPLGAARLVERKYNQAALLARAMGAALGLDALATALDRSRETAPQTTLDRAARLENVAGAFVARRSLEGRRVLLVDDVRTTGATLRAAAHAAESAGAVVVAAAVIAIAS